LQKWRILGKCYPPASLVSFPPRLTLPFSRTSPMKESHPFHLIPMKNIGRINLRCTFCITDHLMIRSPHLVVFQTIPLSTLQRSRLPLCFAPTFRLFLSHVGSVRTLWVLSTGAEQWNSSILPEHDLLLPYFPRNPFK
jgi:hypothetical protein